jgi:hypothetical protein
VKAARGALAAHPVLADRRGQGPLSLFGSIAKKNHADKADECI